MSIKAGHFRNLSLAVATILALPLPLREMSGFYLWTSPFILLNSVLALKKVVFFNVFGFAVFVLVFLKKRWYCRWLCPTGVLCDTASKIGHKRHTYRKLPAIDELLVVISLVLALFGLPILVFLDPINIFHGFMDIFHVEPSPAMALKASGLIFILFLNVIHPHSWCARLCPLGGLQGLMAKMRDFVRTVKTGEQSRFSPNRRYVLAGIISVGCGLTVNRFIRSNAKPLFRPPSVLPDRRLKSVCARCGNCLKVCPTCIIRPSLDSADLAGLLTPVLDFGQSYCLPECTSCGDVCPTGALTAFDVEEKKRLYIAAVRIDWEKCLLTHNRECNRCKSYCAYDAIEIKKYENDFNAVPRVDSQRCVGCAACKIVCPPKAITMVPIRR